MTAVTDTVGTAASRPFTAIEELDHYLENAREPGLVQLETRAAGHLDLGALEAALADVLAADPAARRRLAAPSRWGRRLYWQAGAAPAGVAPGLVTTASWDNQAQLDALRERLSAWPMPLRDTAVRVILAAGPEHDVVIVQVHHSAFDGISHLALLTALGAAYRDRAGIPPQSAPEPPPPSSAHPPPATHPPSAAHAPSAAHPPSAAHLPSETHPPSAAHAPSAAHPPSAAHLPSETHPPSATRPPSATHPPSPARRPHAARRRVAGRPAREPATGGSRRPGRAVLPGAVTRIASRGGQPDRPGYGFVLRSVAVPRPARRGAGPHATVNDLFVAALIATIDEWNQAHGRRSGQIRITVPVNDRDPQRRWAGPGNQSRLIRVTTWPRHRADPAGLLGHVAAQTRAGKQQRRAGLDGASRLLAAGWAPTVVKGGTARLVRRLAGPLGTDTSLVRNLGVLSEPPCFSGRGQEPVWLSGPAPMPRGLAVGAITVAGRLYLSVHYRHALLDRTAAEDFTDAYCRALAGLAAGPGAAVVRAHLGIILALLATVIYSLGFILEKRALTDLPTISVHRLWRLVRTLFTAPAWLAGFVLICGGLVLQVVVLSLEPLTVAQPLQAAGLVVTILFSRLMLHERLGRAELTCIAVMAAAVVLLSLSSGGGTDGAAGTRAAGGAIAAAAVPAFLAGLVIFAATGRASRRRHRRPGTGVSYSLGSGLMYGVTGLALKALSAAVFAGRSAGTALAAAIGSPYLYMALGCLAIGMGLFQTALQRGKASIVIPVSTIVSTGYLVVLGSWLFHERLPAGPLPLAMRLTGAIAALAVPIILTVVSERASAPRPAADPATDRPASHPASHPASRPASRPVARDRPVTLPGKAPTMSLDPLLLDLLACPIDKQALLYLAEDGVLYNPRLRRLYQVCDGIPVMLADQGETVSEDQHRDLLRRAAATRAPATLRVPPRDLLADLRNPADLAADQAAIGSGGRALHAGKATSGEDAA